MTTPEEILDWHEHTFVSQMKQLHRLSTDAPENYSEVIAIQLLGHALGRSTINWIQPKAVFHNSYVALVGKSTLTRKTTSQTFGSDIYPFERRASEETSPEQFVVNMSEQPELLWFMGEWSDQLKGIKSKGYMARFAEVTNHLHGCPERYERKLRKRKGEPNIFKVENAYPSINTTITPEVLKQNLSHELFFGGYMPRFLIVYGVANPRRRKRLPPKVKDLTDGLKNVIQAMLEIEKEDVNFILSDQALVRYNEIESMALKKYERVSSFVGRYMNYVISFADIILVSDAIGKSIVKGISPYKYRKLVELVRLISLVELDMVNDIVYEKYSRETITPKWLTNYLKTINYTNRTNHLIVPSQYIDRAWKIIEPCLEYVMELANYVEMDAPTAKLREYMKVYKKASHSEAMRNTNLNSKQMEIARETLIERKEIRVKHEKYQKHGRQYERPVYVWFGD